VRLRHLGRSGVGSGLKGRHRGSRRTQPALERKRDDQEKNQIVKGGRGGVAAVNNVTGVQNLFQKRVLRRARGPTDPGERKTPGL
jgi:hypothetical protein